MKRALWSSAPLFLAVASLVGLASPASADAPVTTEARAVPAFRAIELAGTLEVEVTIGKPARVEVSAEADLLGKITTVVKDGVLVVDTKPNRRTRSHMRVIVTAPEVQALTLSGTGEIRIDGLANTSLDLSLPGTGTIKAAGTTTTLHAVVDGTGEISAKGLAAKDATIEVNGTGSATLRASQSIEAKVTGTGNIDIHGKPARIKKSVTGLGNIRVR